ncbi:hypothetical protein [Swingsia samuiensis]|uniref:Uncharacterized protein n=1 Tax=Swingsia samuiensis TaxID=1293412 RepID=A0A4Y6UJS4_9PROT|nr:hypothetical protein [Swingsia samuiensis]QDH16726.1 hypothetical protein E3D00_03440 [Swingsia samuiensis]
MMRELTTLELNEVSGGATTPQIGTGTASDLGDALLGALAGAAMLGATGMTIGGIHGGDGGGILGFGSIGQAVGLVIPTIEGAATGFVLGGIYGFHNFQPWINQLLLGASNGTLGQGGNAAGIRV